MIFQIGRLPFPYASIFAFVVFFSATGCATAQLLSSELYVQVPILNVRSQPSLNATVLEKLKQLDKATVLEKGKSDVIDGITDFWYKVKTSNNIVGWVFGHLTSLKQAGQQTVIKKFTYSGMGDDFHLIFEDLDFGYGRNNPACDKLYKGDDMSPDSTYLNKKFELVINSLVNIVYCQQGGGDGKTCIEPVLTIVGIKQVP
jgi:uncharacterized protein YgiM (DUF1202 family)